MANQQLIFAGWVRERVAGLATGVQDGRARVETSVTLTGRDAGGAVTSAQTRTVRFLLAGPRDVVGLAGGAITKRYPTPGAIDHESDRCAHVEFADPGLPWRYTPAPKPAAGTGALHPWLVLIVGVDAVDLTLGGNAVTLSPAVQQLHPLGTPTSAYRWSHVQTDAEGRRVARILSGRLLDAGTDYVAVLVPAFDAAGQPNWTGTAAATVPAYDSWRFRTATPAGSFEDLAARLQPGDADPKTGRAPLDYPRVPAAGDLEVRGALAPLGALDGALPDDVRTDLDGLRTPASDPRGRPIVGLPRYGEAWLAAPEGTTWGRELNTDPRDRGVAGLGLEVGVRNQDDLADEAAAQLGALSEARQRIRELVAGLQASQALWARRMPASAPEQLWLLGPALRRVVTANGSVADLATAADRALPAGLFSSAARRILRPGPARTAALRDGAAHPAAILEAANRCPAPPKRRADGVPFTVLRIDGEELDSRRGKAAETGAIDVATVLEQAKALAEQVTPKLRELALAIVRRLATAHDQGSPAPWAEALELLIAAAAVAADNGPEVSRLSRAMQRFLELFPDGSTDTDLVDLLVGLAEPSPQEPPCRPVDLGALATGVLAAFDPGAADGPARTRVLDTIEGLDPKQPLAPPEACIGLDRPVWADVQSAFAEWLLPGVGALPQDSVIALETNPRFIDALLTGLNTQLLGELRWRNLPVATGCTPLRVFWDRSHTGTGARVDDIVGIANWSDGSAVGDVQHRPPAESGRDLVVVVRGALFMRYPATVVYLVTARAGPGFTGDPDFDSDPDPAAPRVLPSFQGRVADDVTFFGFSGFVPDEIRAHWLVFEEPPTGYRFANDASVSAQPQTWATEAFARPVRVLIRGDRLDPEGLHG
ncbi:MAG TPA: hypothetical protein VLR26_00160 [Frankiaceae bacterium]|nr:hypothetical protein [Frankiaceae bacterium]